MGKQRTTLPNDNLTISRIHVILRPFETKLNVLAKTLERKIAKDKYAPRARQPGVTYAKRHRIRAMTGMNSRQAGRAYTLEKSKGLSTLYSFHEPLIGVEDAFRNLVRGIPLQRNAEERIPSLQAMVCQMIGRQVAEETLRDKEELEAEGVEDCIGLWYESLSVNSRKHALIAHAVQLVELKIPFFILELWTGLLTITIQAGLLEESYILLEYIILYYFTPATSANDCPAANMIGRDLTDLYNMLTSTHLLPPAEFFAILLPLIEASANPPDIWHFRCIQHLIRNLDGDVVLLARVADSMARTLAPAEDKRLTGLVQGKTYDVLTLLSNASPDSVISAETIREVGHLAWTTHQVGKMHTKTRLMGLSLAVDIIVLSQVNGSTRFDVHDVVERLGVACDGDEEVYTTIVRALHNAQTTKPPAEPESYFTDCVAALQARGLGLADALEQRREGMISRGEEMRLRLAPLPSGLLKRNSTSQHGRPRSKKRRKVNGGWKDDESEELTESESEVEADWSTGEEEEDNKTSEDEDKETSEEDDRTVALESQTADEDDEEELEDDSDTLIVSKPQPYSRQLPAPVLRSVVSAKMASALIERLARRTQKTEALAVSSDDDLDLLGSERRAVAASRAGGGKSGARERWSTP